MKRLATRLKSAFSSLRPGAMTPPAPEYSREDGIQFLISDILRGEEETNLARWVKRYQLTLDDLVGTDPIVTKRFYQSFARKLSFRPNLQQAMAYLILEYGKVSENDVVRNFDFLMEKCLPSLLYCSKEKFWLKSIISKHPHLIPRAYFQYNHKDYPDWLFLVGRSAICHPLFTQLAYSKDRVVYLPSIDMPINLLGSAEIRDEHEPAFHALMCLTGISRFQKETVYLTSLPKNARHPTITSLLFESINLQSDNRIRPRSLTHYDHIGIAISEFIVSLCNELLSVNAGSVAMYHYVAMSKVADIFAERSLSLSSLEEKDAPLLFETLEHVISLHHHLLLKASCITDPTYHEETQEVMRSGMAIMAELALPVLSASTVKVIAEGASPLVQGALSDAGFPMEFLPGITKDDRRGRLARDLGL